MTFEQLEDRTAPAGTSFANATLIQPNDLVNDALASAAEVDFYQVDIVETGRLTLTRLQSPGPSVLRLFTLKALEREADGLVVPQDAARPLTLVEFQFDDNPTIYTRTVTKMAAAQEQHRMRRVQGAILFRYAHLDPQTEPWTRVDYAERPGRAVEGDPGGSLPELAGAGPAAPGKKGADRHVSR